MSTSGSRTSSPEGRSARVAADVAEGLDLQFRLAAFAQRGADIDAIDAADFSAGILQFAGAGELLAGLGQFAQFFDQSAQAAQQSAEAERALDALSPHGFDGILFCVVFVELVPQRFPFRGCDVRLAFLGAMRGGC